MSGSDSHDADKAQELSLRPQDSSINFDDNDMDPAADQDMKNEGQIKEKNSEDVVEFVGK